MNWFARLRRRWFKRLNRWSTPFRVLLMIMEQIELGIFPRIDRQLLNTESPIERRLYYALRTEGYKVETQVRCGKYLIDLALPEYRVAIECDGQKFHSSEKQKEHDREKDRYLRRRGWTILRFTGQQITYKLKGCVRRVNEKTGFRPSFWRRFFRLTFTDR